MWIVTNCFVFLSRVSRRSYVLCLMTLLLAASAATLGQTPGGLDESFGAGQSGVTGGSGVGVFAVAMQPDGRVVIGGDFTQVNGAPRNNIARLNADGTLDTSFGAGQSGANLSVFAVAVQPDGRIVIGGAFTQVNGVARNRIARLNADGSLDTSFGAGQSGVADQVLALAIQPDGRIVIGGWFTEVNGVTRHHLARLNADGTLDMSFGGGVGGSHVRTLAVQPDGRIVIGGEFTQVNGAPRTRIARLNADGTLDTSFGQGQNGVNVVLYAVALQADGRVLIGGNFTQVNGVARNGIARLNADGTLDASFGTGQSGTNNWVFAMAAQTNGQIVIGGLFTQVNGAPRNSIARLNVDGTLDTTFGDGQSGANDFVYAMAIQMDGRIVIAGGFTQVNGVARGRVARLFGGGGCQAALTPSSVNMPNRGGSGAVAVTVGAECQWTAISNAPWVRIISAGSGSGNGIVSYLVLMNLGAGPRTGTLTIAGRTFTINQGGRVAEPPHAPGGLDESFGAGQSGAPVNADVMAVAVQADGRVLIGGNFTQVNGAARRYLARLNADGTLDTGFGVGPNGLDDFVFAVAVQPDGRILIGGFFNEVNGVMRRKIARLNADGTLDMSFGAGQSGADGLVQSIAVQPDGRILIGGNFNQVNGVPRKGVARLNADGTLDAAFGDGQSGVDGAVGTIALQSDGRVLIGGNFNQVNGVVRDYLARLNADGTLDTNFGTGQGGTDWIVDAIAVQPDGRIVLGGRFTRVHGMTRRGFARLNADGTPDMTFEAFLSEDESAVFSLALHPNGRIVVGGHFGQVNGIGRNQIARLNADGTLDVGFGAGQSGVTGGASPVVRCIALQTDGRILIGGRFTQVNGVARGGIARLFGN